METKDKLEIIKIKRSEFHAVDEIDYKRLEIAQPYLVPCTIKVEREELEFEFNLEGLTPCAEIKKEEMKDQFQFLINFADLREAYLIYNLEFSMDNVFYNANYQPVLKLRDIHSRDVIPHEEEFIDIYKIFIGGTLHERYTISRIQKSGVEILHKDKFLNSILECVSINEIKALLKHRKDDLLRIKNSKEISVNKSLYRRGRVVTSILLILLSAGLLYTGYHMFIVSPKLNSLVTANQSYIKKDYVQCIDTLETFKLAEMSQDTKYILAISYTQGESFKKDEIQSILAKLSPTGDEKLLDFWILIGRAEFEQAQDLAISLSDDRLLIYAYMKEAYLLEANTTISGAQKRERLDTLDSEIERLGKKYESVEEAEAETSIESEIETEVFNVPSTTGLVDETGAKSLITEGVQSEETVSDEQTIEDVQ